MAVSDILSRPPLDRIFDPPPVVPVIRLVGTIGQAGPARRGGLSLAGLARAIDKAFAIRGAKTVALSINSPGGAPVQSALIAGRIRERATETDRKVVAFVEDVAASGGYWLALAADEIFADANSLIGSIGVVSASFGFQNLINRLGVERRVYTAGSRKMMLDPFQPEEKEDVERLKALQAEIHARFIATVKERRGDRLKDDDDALFSGDIWTGAGGVANGLIDGIGHLRPVLRERFGDRVRLPVFGQREGGLLRRVLGAGGDALADGLASGASAALEDRALWRRYGL